MIKHFVKRKKISFSAMNRVIAVLAGIFFIVLAVKYLNTTRYMNLPLEFLTAINGIVTFVAAYLIASLFIRLTSSIFLKFFSKADVEKKLLATKLYGFVIYLITTVIVLWILGVNAQNITLFIGLITTGLAFALREIIISYMVWFMLLTKKPFRIGDHIKIGEDEGRVEHIGTFYVVLDDTPDEKDDFVRVPNKMFLEKPIVNYGRSSFSFSFSYPLFRELEKNKLDSMEEKIKAISSSLSYSLSSDSTSVKVVVSGRAKSYLERDQIRTKVTRILIEDLSFKS
jgi:small-conductance mechanosensitive channel